MNNIELTINGVSYPCAPTMGAMLRFKKETGKEVTEIDTSSFTELCTYLWCCVASASKREGKDFNLTLMDFADNVTPEDMEKWGQTLVQNQGGEAADKKKVK
ncbi:MAG: hypothetical protein K2J65_11060 [Duncaniella sp.]|nr:hypothetical protein [Duncaniella sp.]